MSKFLVVILIVLLVRGSFERSTRQIPLHRHDVTFGIKNELLCDTTDEVRTEWRRTDGKDLPAGSVQSNGLLAIDPTGHDAAGHYDCVAKVAEGSSETVIVQVLLQVIVPPKITFTLSTPISKVRAGDKVSILCDVSGDQPIRSSWHKANEDSLPDRVRVNGQYLEFPEIAKEDEGRYICRASNRAGNATGTAEVILRSL